MAFPFPIARSDSQWADGETTIVCVQTDQDVTGREELVFPLLDTPDSWGDQ